MYTARANNTRSYSKTSYHCLCFRDDFCTGLGVRGPLTLAPPLFPSLLPSECLFFVETGGDAFLSLVFSFPFRPPFLASTEGLLAFLDDLFAFSSSLFDLAPLDASFSWDFLFFFLVTGWRDGLLEEEDDVEEDVSLLSPSLLLLVDSELLERLPLSLLLLVLLLSLKDTWWR